MNGLTLFRGVCYFINDFICLEYKFYGLIPFRDLPSHQMHLIWVSGSGGKVDAHAISQNRIGTN